MNIVAELTVKALRPLGGDAWANYRQALIRACRRSPPPFGTRPYGDIYRDAATDPHWLAGSLMANAAHEGEGAGQLWDLAACTSDPVVAGQIADHAIDESGHARAYIALLDLAFPGAVDDDFHAQLVTLSPGYTRESRLAPHDGSPFARPVTVDDLIQMNIAEIRTRVHHLLQRPMLLVHCAPNRRHQLVRILDTLLLDETRHIAYTAALIETFARSGEAEQVRRLMGERMADFNAITREEVGRNVFAST
ncbi:MAG: hypothetical protein C5B48_09500 [Candidatus Rokuibacteriota bacterium]|nr:MAG: hypothetical protein C5B48_09500 [Candidatus Rokubacteria bacterium]